MSVVAKIGGLSYSWPGSEEAVFAEVSMELVEGTVTAVLGPSGAGKSTLLRAVAGLLDGPSGRVEISAGDGVPVAMVFQDPRLLPWRTVRGNLAFALEAAGVPAAQQEARWRPLLEQVGLADAVDARPSELSGGMAQRVGVVRALSLRPRLLLMDEPFAAVDPLRRDRLQALVSELLRASGTTAVLVTHDVREAAVMADDVIVLAGRPARVLRRIPVPHTHPRDGLDPSVTAAARQIRAALADVSTGT